MERSRTFGFEDDEQAAQKYGGQYASQAAQAKRVNEKKAALTIEAMRLQNQVGSSASWFYWIAGLSVVNTVMLLTSSFFNFPVGLAVTDFIAAYFMYFMEGALWMAFVLNIMIFLLFVGFGVLARKPDYLWAFPVGMVLYALDALLALWAESWLSLGFHGFALFFLYGGLNASLELRKVEKRLAALEQPAPTARHSARHFRYGQIRRVAVQTTDDGQQTTDH